MAIDVDTTETTPGASGTSVSSLSITNYDGGTGSDRIMLAHAGNSTGAGASVATGVTYNSVAMTSIYGATFATAGANSMWRLTAPATGNNTLTATWSASQDEISIGAVVLTGADGTVDTVQTNQSTGTAPSITYTNGATGDMIVDCIYSFSGGGGGVTFTPGAGQTERFSNDSIGGGWGGGAMSYEAGAASVTMSHTIGGDASQTWLHIAVGVNPAAAAGGGNPWNYYAQQ